MASASIHVMNLDNTQLLSTNVNLSHINVGTGHELSIKQLTELIASTVGFQGDILWDATKPDGTPRKLLESSKLKELGWQPKIGLEAGLIDAYSWYLKNHESS
jgi:GDP-L-fucose synthase